MANYIPAALLWIAAIPTASVLIDMRSYERRQTEWERAHPNDTYIHNYRRMQRASRRLKRKNGEL